jgi:hypothetical protein
MQYAGHRPQKLVRALTLQVAPGDEKFFAGSARVELSVLPPATEAAEEYFRQQNASATAKLFHMFKSYPLSYEAYVGVAEATIDGRTVALLHAPSRMIFDVPAGSRTVSGQFGFVETAYTKGGWTNGARFIVYASDGSNHIELFSQFLNPVSIPADRGLHDFSVPLPGPSGLRLYLETDPGPFNDNGWDWTCWTNIAISK